jgi:hypothetical protein
MQTFPVVDPIARQSPDSSIANPCLKTTSYACFCSKPFLSTLNDLPPSRIRVTTSAHRRAEGLIVLMSGEANQPDNPFNWEPGGESWRLSDEPRKKDRLGSAAAARECTNPANTCQQEWQRSRNWHRRDRDLNVVYKDPAAVAEIAPEGEA